MDCPILKNWWEKYPKLLAWELECFEYHGAKVTIVLEEHGQLCLEVAWPMQGEEEFTTLEVAFSPRYPFSKPAVRAPEIAQKLDRHIDHKTGLLCLLPEDEAWNSSQSVADFISQQLPSIIDANKSRQIGDAKAASELEENTPDPITAYFSDQYELEEAVVYAQSRLPEGIKFGKLTLVQTSKAGEPYQGWITGVEGGSGERSYNTPKWFPGTRREDRKFNQHWVTLEPKPAQSPSEIHEAALALLDRCGIMQPRAAQAAAQIRAKDQPYILPVRIIEEVSYEGQVTGDAWIFLWCNPVCRTNLKAAFKIIRGVRVADDFLDRSPIARKLSGHRVLLIGCGAIGSTIALGLAKSGVTSLTFIDNDLLEPGNTVRWGLGAKHWGSLKVGALLRHLKAHYPWVAAKSYAWNIGRPNFKIAEVSENRFFASEISSADVVIDATASPDANAAIANACQELGKPYVTTYGTSNDKGIMGGLVFRSSGLRGTACLNCLYLSQRDGQTPSPPEDTSTQAKEVFGCNSPAFSGVACDLEALSLAATRAATSAIVEGVKTSTFDLLDLSEDTPFPLPNWSRYDVSIHHKCQNHD